MTELIAHRGASRAKRENTLEAFALALDQGADGIELDVHGSADGRVVVHHDPAVGPDQRRIADAPFAQLAPVPLLEDVLDLVGSRATVYVEIKASRIEQLVVDVIRRHRAKCAVHAFDHRIARRVTELAPEIPVGVLSTSYPIDPLGPVVAAGANSLWQEWRLIDEELVQRAHAAAVRVVAWTVNDVRAAKALVAKGVDALCGDDLPLLRSALNSG